MTARFWILVVLLLAFVAGLFFLIPRLEGDAPEIGEIASIEMGAQPVQVRVEVGDEGSGLRSLRVRVLAQGAEKVVAERHFPGGFAQGGDTGETALDLEIDPAALGLEDGSSTLVVEARDWSMRDGLAGNAAEQRVPIQVDTVPPTLRVRSGLTYVHRGGSGAVVYEVGEATAADGVQVGESFFPGYAIETGTPLARVAIFAVPMESSDDDAVRVVARDRAGNESRADFPVRVFDRQFEDSSIRLGNGFLEGKVRPLAESNGMASGDLATSFTRVNEDLRARNEERIRAVVEDASAEQHWQGAFQQMPNSKVTSRFAERRTYLWNGRPISKAIHYGFDLASTSAAPVTAANAGVVVFADELGIYGRCVIVDHGLGVHSLYAHLSALDVGSGERVARGQALGRSGATGLAGGDHLHFAILVGGEYVDPLEWWDPKWVRSHIEQRLAARGG